MSHEKIMFRTLSVFLILDFGGDDKTVFNIKFYQSIHLHEYILLHVDYVSGFPRADSGKEFACQCRRHKRHGFNLWVGKIP